MAISQVASYMTSDGKKFGTLAEAEAHELSLELDGDLDAIGEKYEIPARTLSTLKRWLPVMMAELGYRKVPTADAFDETAINGDSEEAVAA